MACWAHIIRPITDIISPSTDVVAVRFNTKKNEYGNAEVSQNGAI